VRPQTVRGFFRERIELAKCRRCPRNALWLRTGASTRFSRHWLAPREVCYYPDLGYGFAMNRRLDHERWFRGGALLLALFAVFLIGIGASFWHKDRPGSEASCPICHVSHMPVLVGTVISVQITPKFVVWLVRLEIQVSHSAPIGLDSPPRAPPV